MLMEKAPFPLTLALSLREREDVIQSGRIIPRAVFGLRLEPVRPLPEGEGWGEGEGNVGVVPRTRRGPDGFEPLIISSLRFRGRYLTGS